MMRLGLRSYDKRLVPVISRKRVFAFELQHCNTATARAESCLHELCRAPAGSTIVNTATLLSSFTFELQHCNTATLLFSYPDAPNSYITSWSVINSVLTPCRIMRSCSNCCQRITNLARASSLNFVAM